MRPCLVVAAACSGGLGAPAAVAARRPPTCPAAATARARSSVSFARGRYRLEATGRPVRLAAALVASDRPLVAALAAGDLTRARARMLALLGGRRHVTAIRVRRGGRVLAQTGRYPFDVAGSPAALPGRLGSVDVTIQDVVGFIRLVHVFTGSDVVVRGAGGAAEATLAPALGVPLPPTGCTAIGPNSYAVASFAETDFDGRSLTIWVLRRAR